MRYLGRGEFEVTALRLNRKDRKKENEVKEKKIRRQLEGMVVSWINEPRSINSDGKYGYKIHVTEEWIEDYKQMKIPYQEKLLLPNGRTCHVLYSYSPEEEEVIAE